MKQYILTFAFLLSAVAVFGQNKQEVVRLKNGSVVKGTVVGERNDSIAVKTADPFRRICNPTALRRGFIIPSLL